MILGDLGADVIKIEQPSVGDDTRHWGPPYLGGESYYFLGVNRNKRSLTLNLKAPEARGIMQRLIEGSDVIVENFRPGTLQRLGFGYEQARQVNPRIVYCSISGYGQTGPEAQRPGYDFILQGEAGLISLTGEEGQPPVRLGVPLVDLAAGMWGAIGILASLPAARLTGQGRYIDTSLMESAVAMLSYVASLYFATGKPPGKVGAGHLTLMPYRAFTTATQHIIVCVGNDAMWERFCTAVGLDLAQDPRFRTNADRVANGGELVRLIEERLTQQPADVWLAAFAEYRVPAGPIRTLDQVFLDPQVLARDMVLTLDHPTAGAVPTLGFPVKFSPSGEPPRVPSPTLGQHATEILLSLDYSQQQVDQWRQAGVV
jgi:formyl-CoA transferase/CoA:oxalate CoA-transferase